MSFLRSQSHHLEVLPYLMVNAKVGIESSEELKVKAGTQSTIEARALGKQPDNLMKTLRFSVRA